jgi:hypothetical protein
MSIFDSWLPPAISKSVADIQPVMSTPPCLSSLPHTLSSSLPLHDDNATTNTIAEQHVSANNVTGTQLAEHNNENEMVELHLPPSQSKSTSLPHITNNTSKNPSVFTTVTIEQHLNDDNTIEIQLVESDNEDDTQLQQLSPSPSNFALLESDTQLVQSPCDPPLLLRTRKLCFVALGLVVELEEVAGLVVEVDLVGVLVVGLEVDWEEVLVGLVGLLAALVVALEVDFLENKDVLIPN